MTRLKWKLASDRLETVPILTQGTCTVCAEHTIGSENHFRCTLWYYEVMSLKQKLILVCLQIVLILTQDRCTVCTEHTKGSEIVLHTPDETPR
jgi:hypothetical protein